MNFSANMLGLDNAATPLGLKAMRELQEINPQGRGQQPDDHVPGAQHRGHHADPDLGDRHPPEHGGRAGPGGFNAADIFLPTLIGTFISFVRRAGGGGLGAAHPPAAVADDGVLRRLRG
jgi:hypothetical protein